MILQSLAKLAEREGLVEEPHYEVKQVHWRIVLTDSGKLVGVESLLQQDESKRGKRAARGRQIPVPRPLPGAARSGIKIDPCFLVDNASFVVGLDLTDGKKLERRERELDRRTTSFREGIATAANATRSSQLHAVADFLGDPSQFAAAQKRITGLHNDKELLSNHLIAFRVQSAEDEFVHHNSDVAGYWAGRRVDADSDAIRGQCLVTGRLDVLVDKHPLIKKVPGGSSAGVSVVSFNSSAFESYGLDRNENAPVSRRAAEAYTAALNRLLDDSYPNPKDPNNPLRKQNVALSSTLAAVFWTDEPNVVSGAIAPLVADGSEEAAEVFGIAFEVDDNVSPGQKTSRNAQQLRGSLTGPFTGIKPRDLEAGTDFRLLLVGGGQGRANIRGYYSTRVREVVSCVRQWFSDVQIVGLHGTPALWKLLGSLAVRGEKKSIPNGAAADCFLAIVLGRELPESILAAAVRRCRHEPDRRVPAERAALIKASLNRRMRAHKPGNYQEVGVSLNTEERNRGYLLGRMFAFLEHMQELASGDVNSGITDRYFAAACATPQAVFPRLLKTEVHHYRKAVDGPRASQARWLHGQVSEIAALLVGGENGWKEDEALQAFMQRTSSRALRGFPAFLPLHEQGLFILGFHQQRADRFKKRDKQDKQD